ncbi:MAG: type II toxin-antitoxin system RelE/ParE family toxin [Bacteroidia bacterium]
MKYASIIWSPQAEETYLKTLELIVEKWGKKIALKFDKSTEELIEKIASHKHICPESIIIKLRRCVISEQTSMVYQIINNETIEIITFFDNRSNHSY